MSTESRVTRIQLVGRAGRDAAGERIEQAAREHLSIETGQVRFGKMFVVVAPLAPEQLEACAREALADPLLHDVYMNGLAPLPGFSTYLLVSRLPGVTDDEGVAAQHTITDFTEFPLGQMAQQVFAQELYYFENHLDDASCRHLAEDLLGNPLVHYFEWGLIEDFSGYIPTVELVSQGLIETISVDQSQEALMAISRERLLALNAEEMLAVKAHFAEFTTRESRRSRGLTLEPTDCELEIIAQTWSEHCKHKEFNATIHFRDLDTGRTRTVESLFKTFIRGSTEVISGRLTEGGNNWLVKVFSDNAGIVRLDEKRDFVWKVETHNSPSALDPYGGAITGILGNNRDAFGTGRGGGELLFNTNVLCFGMPDYAGPLAPGQIHPRRIMQGVVHGIEDGGNKSGVPTVNGSIVFDDRFCGKPLVYCGTGAIMPTGGDFKDKEILPGDRIIMAGGRVGKDGIHGATFSSTELDDKSPRSAVQIGSPLTQKLLYDFLKEAVALNLVRCCTDNGAGGLSSSVGELATISGGALVQLDKVPLKYSGLRPWEIFVSESQERMTLVVASQCWDALCALANKHEVEISDVGEFTNTGFLDIRFGNEQAAFLQLDFLHDGVPHKVMEAEWQQPKSSEPDVNELVADSDWGRIVLRLLGAPNICSRESVIRRYDHEVKGRTIVKPLMGPHGKAPQDAGVVRVGFDTWVGVAVSNGIAPRYGDLDPYASSAGAFDEAMRQIIAVGGRLPDPHDSAAPYWSVNDNFCVPDSQYDPVGNPDGKLKLGKLVRMAEALYDMATGFNIPMTSGKDSMKNDFRAPDGKKISVPPTVLFSMASRIDDVRKTVTSQFKTPGDVVYLLGETFAELGASEFYGLFGVVGANVPQVRPNAARDLYKRVAVATGQGLLRSCHDLSDGGLAVALCESAFGGLCGVSVDVSCLDLPVHVALFSESHSRFVVSVAPEHVTSFAEVIGERGRRIGVVDSSERILVRQGDATIFAVGLAEARHAWSDGGKW